MTITDRPAFADLLLRLDTVYDKRPSDPRATEYWRALQDIPIGLLREAIETHIREARTFPRISDLRQLADAAALAHAPKRLPPAATTIEHDPTYCCTACADTGWIFQDDFDPFAGKAPTVRACECKPTNPARRKPIRYASPNTDVRRPW